VTTRAVVLGAARAAVLVVALASGERRLAAAGAPGDKAEASRHFQVGLAAAQAGAYGQAVSEFTRAYELMPNYAVLYNIATAQATLGDAATALSTFERYLTEGGPAIPAQRRAKVADQMKRLVAQTGLIVPHVLPAGARVTLDGGPVAAAPADHGIRAGIRANVGTHKLAGAQEGYAAAEQTVLVAGGAIADVTLTLAPLPAAPPPAASPATSAPSATSAAPPLPHAGLGLAERSGSPPLLVERSPPPRPAGRPPGAVQRTMGYVIGAAGLVTLATGGVLYLRAWSQGQSAINDGCSQRLCQGSSRAEWLNSQDGLKTSRIVAGVGGALVAGGAVLIFTAPSAAGAPSGLALAGRW
jgi:hypothetical protein